MKLQKSAKKERAQGMVEMALIVPILAFMLLGLFEVGYAIWGSLTLTAVDREATRFSIRQGALDFEGYTAADIGYSNVITHTLISNAGQLQLPQYLFNGGGTPTDPRAAIIVTHIVVDTQAPCSGSGCYTTCSPDDTLDDMVLYPDMPNYSYLRYTYPTTSAVVTRLDTAALATQLKQQNDQLNCNLGRKGITGIWSNNSVIIVEMFYEQPQLLGVPIMSWILNPVPLYAQTTMRVDSQDLARCEVYPIALSLNTLTGWTPGGSDERDIWNGGNSSDRGWISWQPNPSSHYVEDELTNPRLAGNDFTDADPTDPSDTMLNAGDWIGSDGGNHNSSEVQNLLDIVKNQTIMVPIWDTFQGPPANPRRYRVAKFALVQITDYCLDSGSQCSYTNYAGNSYNGYITARLVDADVAYACPGNGS